MPTTRWSSLHLLPEGERWIIAAVVSSIERALIDALVFGHSSATGTDPDAGATLEYTRRARSIVELERAMAPEAQATTDGAPTADASAWAGFHAARERQIADYWARRSRILPRQAELKESATRLGARRERTSNLAVSLQILGPPVVLTRDVLR